MKAYNHEHNPLIADDISLYRFGLVGRACCLKAWICLFCCLILSSNIQANPVSEVIEATEVIQMKWLAAEQLASASSLQPFSSDGCSGGLSDGWFYLAENIPAFKQKLGDKPPWEHCCVDHDRVYWMGETKDGYVIRKQADRLLRQCVAATGKLQSEQLAELTSLNQKEVEKVFTIAAEMMYQAVRIGGKPCSLFPWRWGYGWPLCKIHLK